MVAVDHPQVTGRKVTTLEAAQYLGIAASTLCKLRLTGGGPVYIKLGARRVVYDLADLEAWAAASRRKSTSSVPSPAETKGGAK